MIHNKTVGYHLIAILTVIIWGTTFVSTKVLINRGLTPVEILLYRFVLAYIGMWFIAPRKLWARNKKDELFFLASGLCGGSLYFIAENTALGITLASNVSLLICTAPILTAFLSFLLHRKERLKPHLMYGSLIALLGVALVVFNGSFILKVNPAGDLLTLGAAWMWAFYCLILKRLGKDYPTLFITRKVFFYGIVTLVPVLLLYPIHPDYMILAQPAVLANLLFLGLIASMLCYIMWNTAVKELGALQTANYIYVVPLVTLATSALIIHETITLIAIAGSCFILSGVYIAEKGFSLKYRS